MRKYGLTSDRSSRRRGACSGRACRDGSRSAEARGRRTGGRADRDGDARRARYGLDGAARRGPARGAGACGRAFRHCGRADVAGHRGPGPLAGHVPVATLDEVTRLDITIDGTDEVDPRLDLIKGLGGALLWEKIVARASDRLVIVADESKEVARLGTRAPLPVEVVPFGWRTHIAAFEAIGARPVLRTMDGADAPFITDGGHYILDLHFADGIADPAAVEAAAQARAGVVETGLFLGMASTVIVAAGEGVRVLERSAA
jgi:ribose 5-phosphate isomerase